MTILFPQDHFSCRKVGHCREPTSISQSPALENLFAAFHSWTVGSSRRLNNLVPSPPTITLPFLGCYLWCQRKMYIPTPPFGGRTCSRASWASGGQGLEGWLSSHLSPEPAPVTPSQTTIAMKEPDKTPLQSLLGNLYYEYVFLKFSVGQVRRH
jgi:hypothetical protein